ncbi:cytochrome c oxidase subunit 7A [Colletotrichum spaethianum]|uniref:Cytochrome c oxidase subunit 9, mitochondrial n=9 Tax=Colletotrichum TaxID=5455 RepID=H1V2R9_COLHI|nr:Cytochrome c oxidase subunit COX9 [Colletotrichum higginsianum IMI 349063]XP_049133723.1 cytochrome c oxidase subunit 7A [Colletotrichum spaethianum]KAK1997214.1 cytochrome c oxidase subunit COX9 [Colletotrichum falcatum]KZL66982.1 cytochrome C oxidase subunit 7 [Colletotrichum tofieldiae]OHW99764.1 cytochrome c oxidase-like protein [Colletotrichum incanum]TIC91693.1 Cytochrome c oxidase subunit 7A [Colletotrichum higginsianum]WQF89120.1 Putative cytochrome c oxidase, subunit VIIa, fungal 
MAGTTAVKPITGMLRRNLVLDLGIALGLGFAMANVYWYGFHMPRTNARDSYYAKLEQQKAEARGQKA